MKRWTIILSSILVTLLLGNFVYAKDSVDIYEPVNEAMLVINFSVVDTSQKNSPVENVTIELLYDNNGEWININDLEEMKDTYIDLSSDYNGTIVLNNLPYGMYEYKIVSAPEGYEFDQESKVIIIDILNNYLTLDETLTKKVDMAEGTIEKEDKKEDIVEDEKIPSIEIPSEIDVVPEEKEEKIENEIMPDNSSNKQEEVTYEKEIINTNINTITKEIYEEKDSKNKLDDISNTMNETIKAKRERIKMDMIKSFKSYKFVDAIKDAIATIDNPMDTILKAISNVPRDDENDEDKKRKRLNLTFKEVIADNIEKRYNEIEEG